MLKILVPTAIQTTAAEAADYVMQVARSLNAKVIALHVLRTGDSTEAGELSLKYFRDAGQDHDIEVECCFRSGAVIEQIVDFAEENEVNLIVLGASEGNIFDQWISSGLHDSTVIPVLVIPYQIFE